MYLVIDPGRDKCGLALFSKLDAKSGLILREVVQTTLVEDYLKDLFIKNSVKHLILGDRTNHSKIRKLVEKLNKNIKTILIDEHLSSEEGRKLYFKFNPPSGLKKLIPIGLLFPDKPYDDCVAIVLFQRYIDSLL